MNKNIKKNKIKIFLIFDVIMLFLFVMLFDKGSISLATHEVVGLVMLAMAAIHLILHPSYIIKVTKKAFSKNGGLTKKARFSYVLNFILLILLVSMIVSSISISRVVFGNRGTSLMINLHKLTAALMLLIFGLHIGLHHRMIASKLKLNKVVSTILVSLILLFGIYSIGSNIYSKHVATTAYTQYAKHYSSEVDYLGIGYTILSYASIVYMISFSTHLVEVGLIIKRKKKAKNI